MKFNEVKKTQTNLVASKSFTIEANNAAFQVLADKLYKNPIRAIVRELSTNAIDACKEAGVPVSSFTIKVPSMSSPTFYVEDKGIGMSAEDIENVYTKFFASTKTNTNSQTGMFGLGSKTPFAYTNSFTIQSAKDGIKNTYMALLSEDGAPALAKVSETKCTESGTRISFPVNEDDIHMFVSNIIYCYLTFPEKPNLINTGAIENSLIEYDADLNTLEEYRKAVNNNLANNVPFIPYGIYLEMGHVLYNVDLNQLRLKESSLFFVESHYEEFGEKLVLHANIGDVIITPNREDLQYTDNTCKVVHKLLANSIVNEFISNFEKLNFVERCRYLKSKQFIKEVFFKESNVIDQELLDKLDTLLKAHQEKEQQVDNAAYHNIYSVRNRHYCAGRCSYITVTPSELKDIDTYKIYLITKGYSKVFSNDSKTSVYISKRINPKINNEKRDFLFVTEKGIDVLKDIFGVNIIEVDNGFENMISKTTRSSSLNVEVNYFTNGKANMFSDSFSNLYNTLDRYDECLVIPTFKGYLTKVDKLKDIKDSIHDDTWISSYSYMSSVSSLYGKKPGDSRKNILFITASISDLKKLKIWEYSDIKLASEEMPKILKPELEAYVKKISKFKGLGSTIKFIDLRSSSFIDSFNKFNFQTNSVFANTIKSCLNTVDSFKEYLSIRMDNCCALKYSTTDICDSLLKESNDIELRFEQAYYRRADDSLDNLLYNTYPMLRFSSKPYHFDEGEYYEYMFNYINMIDQAA